MRYITVPRTIGWPLAVLVYSLVPFATTAVRLVWFGSDPVPDAGEPQLAAYLETPVVILVHMLSGCLFFLLGALQVSAPLRSRAPRWHRGAGRVAMALGMLSALSGIWMVVFWPAGPLAHPVSEALRVMFGGALIASLALSLRAARLRRIDTHRMWMVRAFAIALAPTTQALLVGGWYLYVAPLTPHNTAVLLSLGWAVNLACAEWGLRRSAERQGLASA